MVARIDSWSQQRAHGERHQGGLFAQPRLFNATNVCYNSGMSDRGHWVFLTYRLPREPSTPRSGLWRKLRRLGAAQLLDGLAALPLDSRNREQMEWLADEVVEAGGEAQIWLAEPATASQERTLANAMAAAVDQEYQLIINAAQDAASDELAVRLRALKRLRKDLARARAHDYFPTPMRQRARAALEELANVVEAVP